ncbi:MAG: TRAP transporter substrate-binding protein [Bdellovibrionales bacterium]|nr:TRAP transporter substrate-binding protein [Bdellovibrionales bacterium]
MTSRRDFLTGAGAAVAASQIASPIKAYGSNKKFRWKMSTTWSPKLPILQESCELFADRVNDASGGRLKIKVFAGGELIPPLTVFDAVSQGTLQMGAGAAYYWAGKAPAAQFFGSVPFGMNPQQFNAWLADGGLTLWEKVYSQFGVRPMAFGNSGIQMGGWFKREIKTLEDVKGLKMRIPGLGGKVMAKAGANVVLMAGSEVYTALERGTIDATEWVGPFHDERLGLYRAAKFYYYPGWHEPGANLELIINETAWQSLPADLQAIVRLAARDVAAWVLERCEVENGPALKRLTTEHKVELKRFPDSFLKRMRELTKEVIAELTASDPLAKEVYSSYSTFQQQIRRWAEISEQAYAESP